MDVDRNKIEGVCGSCQSPVPPGQGFFLRQPAPRVLCESCHEPSSRSKPTTRVQARVYWNQRAQRAIATLTDVSLSVLEVMKRVCEANSFVYSSELGGWGGQIVSVPGLVESLESAQICVEVSDNAAKALVEKAEQNKRDVAGASVRILHVDRRGRKIKEFQKRGVEFLASRSVALLADDGGLGKGHPLDAKILTPSGWVRAGDVRRGDTVFGRDGKPTVVTGVFRRGKLPVYSVRFNDGSSVEVDGDHLWAVQTSTHKTRGSGFRVKSTVELMNDLTEKRGTAKWQIPMCSPVEFSRKELPIDPYLLGVLIGDGNLAADHSVMFTPGDDLVPLEVERVIPDGIKLVRRASKDRSVPWALVASSKTEHKRPNAVLDALRALGLMTKRSHDRFIPNPYMTGSVSQRLALLQGLMDTDGEARPHDGHLEFSSTSKRLSDDVAWLVESLGGTARRHLRREPRFTHRGEVRIGRSSHRVTIALPDDINPLRAFAFRYKPRKKYPPCRTMVAIEAVGQKDVVCIQVSAKDRLYLTEHCIVTHNTMQILNAAGPKPRIMVVAPKLMVGAIVNGQPVGGWAEEIATWRPDIEKITILQSREEFRWPEENEAVLLNYELMPVSPVEVAKTAEKAAKARREAISKGLAPPEQVTKKHVVATEPPDGVELIGDEAHAFANPNSQRAKRFKYLRSLVLKKNGRVRGVTATPMKNNAKELYAVLDSIGAAEIAFGSYEAYARLHDYQPRQVARNKVTWEFNDPSPEVAERLKRVMLRRKKRDVLTDLPPLTIRRLMVDVDREAIRACDVAMKEIEGAGFDVESAMELVDESRDGKLDFTKISAALSALAKVKAPYAIERAAEYERTGTPVVFFAAHLPVIEALGQRKGWGCLVGGGEATANYDGSPVLTKGPEVASAFQSGRLDNIAATIQYAGVGINLTRASEAVLVEQMWNPGMNSQAIWRIERIGQENHMLVTIFVANHPLDIRMSEVLEKKLYHYAATVDAAAVAPEDLNKREDVVGKFLEAASKTGKKTI